MIIIVVIATLGLITHKVLKKLGDKSMEGLLYSEEHDMYYTEVSKETLEEFTMEEIAESSGERLQKAESYYHASDSILVLTAIIIAIIMIVSLVI